ncbi:hypothetical protein, partial [uncultured Gammaproteobacteria bacterium]
DNFVWYDVMRYSPPHRWLRNAETRAFFDHKHSPPHRWLRNL